MKFQKLTIHNIASIEDAVIDFEAEPLAGSEVFLITGKTGAGKSTILDAICLALFDATPRLDSTRMQGETKDGDNEIKIKDTRQLMRRNTGEASITLTFTGLLKEFGTVMAATGGGPAMASSTICMYIYNCLFSYNRAGYGQAVAISFMAVLVLIGTVLTNFFRKREVEL